MYAASAAFQAAILKSHTALFKAEILANGQVIQTVTQNFVGGSVTVDTTAQVWRSGTAVFVDKTGALIPLLSSDNLTPYGNELRIYRGAILPSGVAEYVPVITGGIYDTTVDDFSGGPGVQITCDIYDRSRAVSLAKFTDVYPLANNTNVSTAIQGIIQRSLPSALLATTTPNYTSTSATTPALVLGDAADNDPFQSCQDLASGAGLVVFFDPLGNPVLKAVPDPIVQDPAITVAPGGSLLKAKRRITAESTYNGVVAIGENTSATVTPYRATVWDTSPSSPTYYLGKFGKRPRYYSSPFINSNSAATSAGLAILLLTLGGTELVTFGTLVNPALDGLDVILLTAPGAGVNTETRYVLDSFNIPMDVITNMDAVCRVRRTT